MNCLHMFLCSPVVVLWAYCIFFSATTFAMVLKNPRHNNNRHRHTGDGNNNGNKNAYKAGRLRMTPPTTSTTNTNSRYFTEVGELPPLLSIGSNCEGFRSINDDLSSLSSSFGDNETEKLILPYTDSLSTNDDALGAGVEELQSTIVPVTYTNDPRTVYKWFSDNLPYTGCTVGFDVEFVPRLPWFRGAAFQGPATVQLATPKSCLVVHLVRHPSGRRSQACSPILKAVLCDECFVKAGCALDEDMLALYDIWDGLDARSRLDLGGIGAETAAFSEESSTLRTANQRRGLKSLSRTILGVDLPKSKTQARSDWSSVPLTESQIIYSARDAWAGAAIVEKLAEYDPETFGTSNLVKLLADSETPVRELMGRKKRRDRAKADLGKILKAYSNQANLSSSSTTATTAQSNNGEPPKKHATKKRLEWPGEVVEKVRSLRHEIKTSKMDRPLVFDVDGFHFDIGGENVYKP